MDNKAKILVVEDDRRLLELYVKLLTGAKYQVDSAADGKAGLAKMQQGGYDLVLLDIIMPEIDGIEIMNRLRSSPPKQANKKVVFLTNVAENQTIAQALKYNVGGYLIKSRYNPEQFLQVVQSHLK